MSLRIIHPVWATQGQVTFKQILGLIILDMIHHYTCSFQYEVGRNYIQLFKLSSNV